MQIKKYIEWLHQKIQSEQIFKTQAINRRQFNKHCNYQFAYQNCLFKLEELESEDDDED